MAESWTISSWTDGHRRRHLDTTHNTTQWMQKQTMWDVGFIYATCMHKSKFDLVETLMDAPDGVSVPRVLSNPSVSTEYWTSSLSLHLY